MYVLHVLNKRVRICIIKQVGKPLDDNLIIQVFYWVTTSQDELQIIKLHCKEATQQYVDIHSRDLYMCNLSQKGKKISLVIQIYLISVHCINQPKKDYLQKLATRGSKFQEQTDKFYFLQKVVIYMFTCNDTAIWRFQNNYFSHW